MEAISKNGAKLYTATEWRNKLKLHWPIQKLVAANIQKAELYIASPWSAMLHQDTKYDVQFVHNNVSFSVLVLKFF